MNKTEIITKEQCDKLLHNCYMINALAWALMDNTKITEDDGIPASNLAECISDYNNQSVQIIDNGWDVLANEAQPESKTSEA